MNGYFDQLNNDYATLCSQCDQLKNDYAAIGTKLDEMLTHTTRNINTNMVVLYKLIDLIAKDSPKIIIMKSQIFQEEQNCTEIFQNYLSP